MLLHRCTLVYFCRQETALAFGGNTRIQHAAEGARVSHRLTARAAASAGQPQTDDCPLETIQAADLPRSPVERRLVIVYK